MSETIVGIIGGTGLYALEGLEQVEETSVDTPFGEPSSKITSGILRSTRSDQQEKGAAVKLLFLARHGPGHVLLPSEVNYRANIFALKSLGAQWCLSVSAVGSLQEELRPGDVLVPDQLIDRTKHRESTFFGRGLVAHVAFADPFCPVHRAQLEAAAVEAAEETRSDARVHRGGTYVCMEGPAFSTRAESRLYRSWEASVIGMTALPEAKLAREAELAYATLAMVTDYDCWRSSEEDVDVAEILATMARNAELAKACLRRLAPRLAGCEPSPMAADALAQALITPRELIPDQLLRDLAPLLGRYAR